MLPPNRLLQIRVIPRQAPKRFLDHLPQFLDPRVVVRFDVALGELGFVARAGAASKGEVLRGRVGRASWEVWVGWVGGVCDSGVGAGEGGRCWHFCGRGPGRQ